MKEEIQKPYALDMPPESERVGPDAWTVEGAARFANRLLWSALVDMMAVKQATAAGRAVTAEKQELADDARAWISGAEDCRVTFDMCVELLFSSDIPDLADKMREAIEVDPARVLTLVEEAMREAQYEATVYRFMQRAPVAPAGELASQPEDRWQAPAAMEHNPVSETAAAALMVELPPLPAQSALEVRVLAGGQYLLPLLDEQEDQFASAYDSRAVRTERVRGM